MIGLALDRPPRLVTLDDLRTWLPKLVQGVQNVTVDELGHGKVLVGVKAEGEPMERRQVREQVLQVLQENGAVGVEFQVVGLAESPPRAPMPRRWHQDQFVLGMLAGIVVTVALALWWFL